MHGKTIKNAMQFVGSIFANIRLRQAESVILAAAEEVAGQDIHMAHPIRLQTGSHGGDILFRIVQSGHERNADMNFFGKRLQSDSKIVLDEFVSHSGEPLVLRAVHVLDVEKEKVGPAEQPLEQFGLCLPAGINTGMQALIQTGFDEFHKKCALHGAFPAAEGYTAPGIAEKGGVLADDFHDCIDIVFPPRHAACGGGALFGASAAPHAAGKITEKPAAFFDDCAMRTDLHAMAAAGTQVLEQHELRGRSLGFRVAAPQTVQGTALEEDGCPQTGAVMDGHPLNIINDSFSGHDDGPWLAKGTGRASPRGGGKNGADVSIRPTV